VEVFTRIIRAVVKNIRVDYRFVGHNINSIYMIYIIDVVSF